MTSDSQSPSPRRWLLWFGLSVGVVAALSLWLWRSPRVDARTEVPRGQLTLRDGQLFQNGASVPFTGVVVESYATGSRKSRSVVSDGRLEGLSEGWHTNGQPQIEEHYRAGVAHGRRVKWHPNGQKSAEVEIVAGKLEGVFRRWHENGVLAEDINLKQGQPDGLSRAFYPSGCLKADARMQAGKVIERHDWKDGESPAGTLANSSGPPAAAQ
jgi:antitoxin component YwqK of YwqJK toxin-antitoxin module